MLKTGNKKNMDNGKVLLREVFPHLWASVSTSADVRADLKKTSIELGSALKRGKSIRLAKLRDLENELEVSALKVQLMDHSRISNLLNDLPCKHGSILDVAQIIPSSLVEAETILSLAAVFVGQQVRIDEFDSNKCKKLLDDLNLDEIDVQIFRGQISVSEKKSSIAQIASTFRISRQSVNERRRRLYKKLHNLEATAEFSALNTFLIRRARRTNAKLKFRSEDPIIAIRTVANDSNFATVVDVINTSLWLLQESFGEISL